MTTSASPWYPLLVAQVVARGRPLGRYPVPYEHWLLWHRDCVMAGHVGGPAAGDEAFVRLALMDAEPKLAA